jgi:histone acetyltransferase (RNA polymerase elongator complex component)
MRRAVREYLASSGGRYRPAEIAFYGGSFTGMPLDEQMELLGVASALIAEGAVQGIRISTRPDDIDGERLCLLASMDVRTVEIGAQSMDDEVLRMSGRGHSAGDIRRAAALCKGKGFETAFTHGGAPGQNGSRSRPPSRTRSGSPRTRSGSTPSLSFATRNWRAFTLAGPNGPSHSTRR